MNKMTNLNVLNCHKMTKHPSSSVDIMTNPNNSQVLRFGEIALPMFKRILKNARESRKLAEMRDALLPKLMSGELEVA